MASLTIPPLRSPTRKPLKYPFHLPPQLDPSCVLCLLPIRDNKWYDFSGHGNHGTIHNATWTAKGPRGTALYFDGLDDYVKITTDTFKTQPFSVLALVKTTDTEGAIIDYENGNAYHGWRLQTTEGKAHFTLITSIGTTLAQVTSNSSVNDNNLHYIVATNNATTLKIYIDGCFENSADSAVAVWDTIMYSYLGFLRPEASSPAVPFSGLIGLVLIFTRALSASEVKALDELIRM